MKVIHLVWVEHTRVYDLEMLTWIDACLHFTQCWENIPYAELISNYSLILCSLQLYNCMMYDVCANVYFIKFESKACCLQNKNI